MRIRLTGAHSMCIRLIVSSLPVAARRTRSTKGERVSSSRYPRAQAMHRLDTKRPTLRSGKTSVDGHYGTIIIETKTGLQDPVRHFSEGFFGSIYRSFSCLDTDR